MTPTQSQGTGRGKNLKLTKSPSEEQKLTDKKIKAKEQFALIA